MVFISSMTRNKVKSVLITGGTGFIGRRVVVELVRQKYLVSVISRGKSNLPKGVKLIRGDLLKPASFESKIGKPDAVIHLAGNVNINYAIENPAEVFNENVSQTLNLLEALRKKGLKPLVIFSSTDRMYGKTKKKIVFENEPVFPLEPYVSSKICGELLLETYRHLYGVPYIIFRIDSVYGPGQPERMFISAVIKKMISGSEVTVGNLDVRKNFVYVDDVARAFLAALSIPDKARNTVYNLGGEHSSLREIFYIIKEIVEKRLKRKIGVKFDKKFVRKSGTEVNPFRLSMNKAKKILGWKPKTNFKNGLEKTFNYFIKDVT